jgi:hypothetical protein
MRLSKKYFSSFFHKFFFFLNFKLNILNSFKVNQNTKYLGLSRKYIKYSNEKILYKFIYIFL